MKTLYTLRFVVALLLFTTFSGFSQQIITAEQSTSTFLKKTLEDAYIDVLETKDNYLKTKDTFNIFLDLDPNKRYIMFNSSYLIADNTSAMASLELMNMLNSEIALIKCYYDKESNTINYIYYFWIEGGYTQKTLISAYKLFKSALSLSLDKDTNKLIR